ncbi:MAG: pseudouridine synthase [Vicinamibacteria bacterium]
MQERLQKILARAGFASRRGAEALILEGRVTLNGEIARELGTKADLATDDVRVDGVRVKASKSGPAYIVLNKPKGVVTTRSDPEGRPTVMGLVPALAGLFPIGRLDVTTEGLILLTNDGAFAERVSHPRYEVPRVYHAKVAGVPDDHALERLRRGVRLDDDFVAVDRVRVLESDNNSWVEVTLHEGKHHEVRRLLEAVGHPVSKLKRVAFGPVTTKGLEPGEFRALTPEEIEGLRKGIGARIAPSRIAVRRGPKPKPPASREDRPRTGFGSRSQRPFAHGQRRPAAGERRFDRGSRPPSDGFEPRRPRPFDEDRGSDRDERGFGDRDKRGFDRGDRGGFERRGFDRRGEGGGERPFRPRGAFEKRSGSFEKRSGGFEKRSGSFEKRGGGFEKPAGSFGRRPESSEGRGSFGKRSGGSGGRAFDKGGGFEKRGRSTRVVALPAAAGLFDRRLVREARRLRQGW